MNVGNLIMATTRFPHGVTNVTKQSTLGAMGQLDPTEFHTYFDDFDYFTGADWIITTVEAGGGVASETLANEDGGVLLLTNDNFDDDSNFLNKGGASFLLETNKAAWFKARFKVSDATQSDFVIGLQIIDTTPLDVTDGIFFQKDDGDTALDFHVEKDNVATTATAIHTMVDDTYVEVGFYYNGTDEISHYINDAKTGTLAVTNLPDDEELTISFGIQNGEAAIKTMSIDYILAVKER